MTVEFRLLGGVDVCVDGESVPIGGPRRRGILAVLLVEANRAVPADQILDRAWGTQRPLARPDNALQTQIKLLRRALAPIDDLTITWQPAAGYRLTVDERTVDLHEFDRLARQAQDTDDAELAASLFGRALDLWRGEPFASLDTPWLTAVRAKLCRQRHAVELDLIDNRMRAGQHAALLTELADLAAAHPLDERLAAQLMLALYRSGRPAEALQSYQHLRRRLADELGTDPSPALRELHQRVLTVDPTLAAPAPTPASAPSVPQPAPRQLPAPPRLFTGRGSELAHLDQVLDEQAATGGTVAISAIGGVGGIGKTWLALHWAHRHIDRFPDGQLYVNLRGFDPSRHPTPATDAIRGLLGALGVDPATLPADLDGLAARYRGTVAGKRMLIVLDNARDVDQVVPLLPGSPTCTVLVTSRQRLAGLATAHGAGLLDLDVLPEPDARQLLARLLGPERLTAEPDAVAELLAVCAGLPLAVRIVAARAQHHPTFPLAVLADELRDASARLDGLNAGNPHVNLRAVLSWSFRTLGDRAAGLFGLLGIAPGQDVSLAAAAALAELSDAQARVVLRELENASLVQQHAPNRYRMHDLIRLFATDATDTARDVSEAALRRVIDFYVHTAHGAARVLNPHRRPIQLDPPVPGVRPQSLPDVSAALAWFDTEYPTLMAAQDTAAGHDWPAAVWQLAWTMDTFLNRRALRHERLAVWLAALPAATYLPDPTAGILAHRYVGTAYTGVGRYEEAIEYLHRTLALAEEHRDQQAHTHMVLANVWAERGDDRRALEHATRARDLQRALGRPLSEADALNSMGWYAAQLGEYDTARADCQAALALHREHDNPDGEAATLDSLGYIDLHSGRHQQAIDHYQQALALFRAVGNVAQAVDALDGLGHCHVALREYGQARVVWREELQLCQEQGRDADVARIQRQLAKVVLRAVS